MARELLARFNSEDDPQRKEATLTHGKLLEELKRIGVTKIIEDEARTKIPDLLREENGVLTPINLMTYARTAHKSPYDKSWRLDSAPYMGKGKFDKALVIRGTKLNPTDDP